MKTTAQTTPKKPGGVTGKGFKPGKSGNPGGRPKGVITTALLKQLLKKAAKGQKRDLEAVIEGILGSAKKGDAKAFVAIRDTIDGRPEQEDRNPGPAVIIQFLREPKTPAIQVASKPEI